LTLAFHPYANLFPLIEGQEFYELAEDIRLTGLRDRIDLIWVGKDLQILDGRNRYRALVWLVTAGEMLGAGWGNMEGERLTADYIADYENLFIYVIADEETDGYPLAYVLSKNLSRRHLNDDQRRLVAARLVNLKQGRPAGDKTSQIANISRDQAAERLTTDVAGVDRARSVIAHAVPEVVKAIEQGKLSVTGEHELVLVGVRGKAVPPATAHFRSSFSAPVGEHSEKPDNIHEIIEFHWANTPKVEFNARRARPADRSF